MDLIRQHAVRRFGHLAWYYDRSNAYRATFKRRVRGDEAAPEPLTQLSSTRYEIRTLRSHTAYRTDRLQCPILERPGTTSGVIMAGSLEAALQRIADQGDPVAAALVRACVDGRCHRHKLFGNYFAFRESANLISYTPAGSVPELNEDGTWKRAGRHAITPARFVNRILSPVLLRGIKDHVLSNFAIKIRAEENAEGYEFEVVSSVAGINEVYDRVEDTNSCMAGDYVGEFYHLAGASVVVAKLNDEWVARAILWPAGPGGVVRARTVTSIDVLESNPPPYVMDRVYGSSCEHSEALLQHARASGWWHKVKQSKDSPIFTIPGTDTEVSGLYIVPKCDVRSADFYPYLDTFRWQNSSGQLHSSNMVSSIEHTYCNTDGTSDDTDLHEGQMQDIDGVWHGEDEMYVVGGDWYHQDDDRIVLCRRSREYILVSNAVMVDGDWYAKDDDAIVWCEDGDKYILASDAVTVTINGDTWTVHENCVTRYSD